MAEKERSTTTYLTLRGTTGALYRVLATGVRASSADQAIRLTEADYPPAEDETTVAVPESRWTEVKSRPKPRPPVVEHERVGPRMVKPPGSPSEAAAAAAEDS